MAIQITPRPQWASFTSYLLVMIGAIVGIGNILLFPLLVFHYGGLFILFCLLCEIILAVPLLYAELLLGQRGKQNVVGSVTLLAYEVKASRWWRNLGWLYFVVAFFTFAYYIVYAVLPIGLLTNSLQTAQAHITTTVLSFTATPEVFADFSVLFPCVLLLLLAAMYVVWRGIHRGLEVISCITVPIYLLILLALAGYIFISGNPFSALQSMPFINADNSVWMIFFAALTFSFLKLKVGIGSMVVYASHLPFSVSLKRSTCWIVLIDIAIALLALFVVFPLLQSASATTLTGELSAYSIDVTFKQIPHGILVDVLFFFAVVLAAWTPLIAMLETMVTTISEEWNIVRSRAVWLTGLALFLLILFIVLCQTQIIHSTVLGYNYPQLLREIALEKLIPLAAFFMAIFVGWVVDSRTSSMILQFSPLVYAIWSFLIRYVIPVLILIIFIKEFPIG